MSIESHLVSLRTYLEEIASQNKEILAELKRTGQAPRPAQKTTDAFLAAVTQDVLSKPPSASKDAVGSITVETVKESPLKTTETVQVKPAPSTKKSK